MMKRLSEETTMGATLIVKCTQCGGLTLCGKTQKNKVCPYCGTNVNLQKAQRVASANTAFEASEILRKLKSDQKTNRKKP
jgi:acetyl-CoA carboxylase beta subunit